MSPRWSAPRLLVFLVLCAATASATLIQRLAAASMREQGDETTTSVPPSSTDTCHVSVLAGDPQTDQTRRAKTPLEFCKECLLQQGCFFSLSPLPGGLGQPFECRPMAEAPRAAESSRVVITSKCAKYFVCHETQVQYVTALYTPTEEAPSKDNRAKQETLTLSEAGDRDIAFPKSLVDPDGIGVPPAVVPQLAEWCRSCASHKQCAYIGGRCVNLLEIPLWKLHSRYISQSVNVLASQQQEQCNSAQFVDWDGTILQQTDLSRLLQPEFGVPRVSFSDGVGQVSPIAIPEEDSEDLAMLDKLRKQIEQAEQSGKAGSNPFVTDSEDPAFRATATKIAKEGGPSQTTAIADTKNDIKKGPFENNP